VARIKVVNCAIDVTIVSGPRVFHEGVIRAIKQYKCIPTPDELFFTQDFSFKLD
jgi:protein TonB